jgi:hypothetical protein
MDLLLELANELGLKGDLDYFEGKSLIKLKMRRAALRNKRISSCM